MKKGTFFQQAYIDQKFSSLTLFFTLLACICTNVQAQTSTRFNDGYLTVFRQSAPSGSSFTLSGTTTSGSATITVASTASVSPGMSVSGTGLPSNSAVLTVVNGTTLTINQNATASATNTHTYNAVLQTTGTAIYLNEYLPSTAAQSSPNYTVTLSPSGSTGIVAGATTTSNGALSRSENGRYILVPGFSTNTGGAALGALNSTNILNAVRPVNGSGTIATGITGTSNWFTAANDYRGSTSDDGTNYWVTGGTVGIRTTTDGTTLTTVSTTKTNTRAISIFNGQLYFSTGSATTGIYAVGSGKPVASGTTSTLLTGSSSPYGFALSPDGLTLYMADNSGGVYRYTYNGSTWSTGFVINGTTGLIGLAVDWTGYAFNAASGNGAVIYACNTTTLLKGNDNGTNPISATTLATLTGLNTFKQLAFSPIKQTVSLGGSSPSAGNIVKGNTDVALFQFNLTANEGNSTIKKVVVNNSGTAALSTDFSSFRLIDDANGNGVFDGGETVLSTGTVSGSNVTFSSITLSSYITQGSNSNFLVIANVASGAAAGNSFIPSIVSNKTVNSVNYTTNLFNAGGSFVNIGGTAPSGNTLTIVGPIPAIALSSPSQIGAGSITQGTVDQPVSNFQADVTLSGTTLNTVTFTIGNGGGTYTTGDVSNFKLWYNGTSNTFGSASQIGSTFNSTSTASGGTVSFSSLTQAISSGSSGYFWITATINGSATPNDKFNVSVPSLTFSAGNQSGSISAGGNQTILMLTPTITLANGTIAAGTITENTNNNVLYRTDVTIGTTGATLNAATFTTAGSYVGGDIGNLKLWYSTSTTFLTGTATLLSTLTIGLGTGLHTFSSLSQSFAIGTAYLFVTTDLPCGSFNNATINVSAISNTDFTFASGTPTGSGYTAGGIQTMSSTTNNVIAPAATNGNASSVVSWTNPAGCYNEEMIVVAPASNTGTPTGDGSAYAASLNYVSGTALGNGYVVYKGITSPQTVVSLVNNATYYMKIFTRNGLNWSAGVEVTAMPVAPHFTAGNLSVETVGSGSALSSAAANVSVREYTTAGALTYTFPFSGATTGLPSSAPWYVTESGSATSAGQINRASNGSLLVLPGYNALVGQTSVVATTTPTNKRVIGVIKEDGAVSTTAYDFFSANNFRSIASNGYSFWAAGTVTGGAGLYYLKDANSTPVSLGSVNTRVVKIFNNKLYYATATTGGTGIYQVSTNGLPLSVNDVALARLTDATYAVGGSGGPSPYAFDINPAETIMYIADDATFVSTSTQKGGILKYTKSGGVWSYQYTLQSPSGSARGLVVDWTTANPTIYFTNTATNNNAIYKTVDAGSSSTATTVVANAGGTGYVFRGLQFSPVALTSAQLTCTVNQLNFGGEPVGFTTPEKAFNVAGSLFTGNMTVTAPLTSPAGQYGLSLTPGGPYTQSVTIAGGAPANATVYMVLAPNAVGTYNGNLTISATGATNLLVPVSGKGIIPVNYYNVSGADITQVANWGTNTNGSGTKPVNFVDDGQYFNVTNTPLALASSATTAAIDQLANTAAGNVVLTFTGVPTAVNSPGSLVVGATISGTGIPVGTTISAISANTITMSAAATITNNAGVTISVAITAPFTISGSLSKLVVGTGISLTIPTTKAYSGTADVDATGTLILQNNALPTLGVLNVASTVNYNQTGAATVQTATYGNLTLQGTSLAVRTLPTSSSIALDLKVLGNFLADNVMVSGATVSPFTFMELGGNLTMANGAVMVAATPTTTSGLLNVVTTGNNNQTLSYTGGGVIRLNTYTSTKSAGTMTLASNTTLLANNTSTPTATYNGTSLNFSGTAAFVSQSGSSLNATGVANINLNFSGSATATLGGNVNASDNSSASFAITPTSSFIASFPAGTAFNDGGNNISIAGNLGMGGAAAAYNLTGTVTIATRTGSSSIGDAALSGVIAPHLNNFIFAPIAGSGAQFLPSNGSTIYVDNDFTLAGTSTSSKVSGQGNTIKISGNYNDTRNVDMISASTTTYEFSGSVAQTFATSYASGESFFDVKINNSAGVTMTSGDMKIGASGNLNCTAGILTTGTNKVLLDATAFVVESTSSYVLGNVQTTRTLGTITEAFGNLGLSITASSAPGSTTVLRKTGTSNAIGCTVSSVKRTFTITNAASSVDATLAYTFVPVNELNGLTQSDLVLFNGNTPIAASSLTGNTITVMNLPSIAGSFSAAIDAPTITLTAAADDVCRISTSQTTNLNYTATSGDIATYSITWNAAALSAGFTNVSNAAFTSPISITVAGNTAANTYTGTLTAKNTSGCVSTGHTFTITVNAPVTPLVAIAITTGTNPTCVGGDVTFTATPTNGGATPFYQWKRDGVNVGTNAATYTDGGLTAGAISVIMTTSLTCITSATATSNVINLTTVTNSWKGTVSTNWNLPANWCANQVPSSTENVIVPSGLTNYPSLQTDVTMNNLTVQTGATLNLNGRALTVSGTFTGGGAFKGSSASSLTLNGASGTVNFTAGFGELKSFTLNTGASATLGSALGITSANNGGTLTVNSGATLATGGNLTIRSSVNGTGRIANSAGTISGNVTVERFITQNAFRAWRMLSAPTMGQTIKQSWQENQAALANGNPGYGTLLTQNSGSAVANGYDAQSAGNSLLSYNSGTNSWVGVGATTSPIATTSGYMVYIRGDRSVSVQPGQFYPGATTLRTTGTIYQGTQTAVPVANGQNVVVGNVYASAVDWNNLTKTNLASSFKVWDPKLQGTNNLGGFQTFAFPSYTPVPGGGSYGNTANTRIESGQAFFVTSSGGGSIQFTEAAKTTGSRNVFRDLTQYQQFTANLNANTVSGFVLADGNAVYFDPSYSNAVNNDDATKINNFGENFGILRDGFTLAVETRATADTMFYKISNMKVQQYQLQFVSSNFDTSILSAKLEDSFLNTSTPILLHDTVNVLFSITSNTASSAQNRFRIVFKTKQILPVTFISIHAAKQDKKVKVDWKIAQEQGIRQYEVERSANGREFSKVGTVAALGNSANEKSYSWLDEAPLSDANYYRVKSMDAAGDSKYTSVVKVVMGARAEFVVTPNPVKDGRLNVQFINQAEGTYSIRLLNTTGQVMLNQSIKHNGGDNSYTLSLPATVSSGLYSIEISKPDNSKEMKNVLVANAK